MSSFLLAVAVAYLLAVVSASQSVIARLQELGPSVDMALRLKWTGHDIIGMLPIFLPTVAVGLLIAFLVTALVVRFLPNLRTFGYLLGGAIGLMAIHLIMREALDITPVAIARTSGGVLIQGVAGAVGGWCFARMTRPSPSG